MQLKEKNAKKVLFISVAVIFVWSVFVFMNNSKRAGAEEEIDDVPPKIYNIAAPEVTATSAVITWITDEDSDSLVNYGLDKDYGIAREPFFDKKNHQIVLEGLLPGKTYFFRVTSSDEKGNQGISSDFTFETPKDTEEGGLNGTEPGEGWGGIEDGKGFQGTEEGKGWGGTEDGMRGWEKEGENTLTEIIERIEQVTSEEILEKIIDKVQEVAGEKVKPPVITIDLAAVEVGADFATISWKTDKEANGIVSLVADSAFDASRENPYSWSEGNPDEMSLEHTITVNGLQPATIYHYQVSSRSAVGLQSKSNDGVFRTDSIDPEIINLRIGKIEEHSVTLLWTTNVPCNELVEYTNLVNNKKKLEGNSSLFTFHSVQLNDLDFDTPYRAYVRVENEFGKEAESNPIYFTTTKDEVPPEISKVGTESTLYPGADNKVQTIINWFTDEPAVCELSYQKGLGSEKAESLLPEQDYVLKHVQVAVNFLPATVYKFWIKCQDPIGNTTVSKDFTMLTPSQEKSILDIIIGNFESSFGWMKNMKFGGNGG